MGLKAVSAAPVLAANIDVGVSVITGGTNGGLLYNNSSVLGATSLFTTNGSIITGATGSTLSLGGATIGSNALAVTGTAQFSGGIAIAGAPIVANAITLSSNNNEYIKYANALSQSNIVFSNSQAVVIPQSMQFRLSANAAAAPQLNDLIMVTPSGNSLQFGGLDAATLAGNQVTRIQSVLAGTAATNGVNWTLIGSLPTGTGTSGDIIFQTGVKTGSGTTQGTPTTALTIKGETQQVAIGGSPSSGYALTVSTAGGNSNALSVVGQSYFNGLVILPSGVSGSTNFDNLVKAWSNTAIPAGGTAGTGFQFSSTANFGIFFGSGAPTLSAAKGSLYLRSDGTGVADRMYVNSSGSTTWVAVTTGG